MRLLPLSLLLTVLPLQAQRTGPEDRQAPLPDGLELRRNLDYVGEGNPRQRLDLLLPKERAKDSDPLPLIVFIHGGAWRAGSKDGTLRRLVPFVQSGHYLGATLNYRLSGEAKWPAQIHDVKAAIRYLRGHAEEFGIDPDKIAVWGTSAGGHLVAMLGTSGDVKELEGDLGNFDELSSRVTCVVNFFGPANLLTMVTQKSSINRSEGRDYPEAQLLGGPVPELTEKARQASPVTWISKDDPPFLTAHGTEDLVVPFPQATELHQALEKAGVESHLIPMQGAGHGFGGPEISKRVEDFLGKHLREQEGEISSEPIPLRRR